jgi:Ca-activated chloride channel family protein
VFVQSVANIEPGREIDVTLKYFHTLACVDGWFDFVFPMVVGPRFNPPGTSQGVGAAGRGHRGVSGQRTEVSYLAPSERSGHVSLRSMSDRHAIGLTCPSHRTESGEGSEHHRVRLGGDSRRTGFRPAVPVDGAELKSSLLVHPG